MDNIESKLKLLLLPYEKILKSLLFSKRKNLIYWFLSEILYIYLILWILEGRSIKDLVYDYGVITFVGACAINLDVYIYLFLSEKTKKFFSDFRKIINNDSIAFKLYEAVIYNNMSIHMSIAITTILGLITFSFLGLSVSVKSTFVFYCAIILVFAFAGMTLGLIINIWLFISKLGTYKIEIDPTHYDRMGGLKFIGDYNKLILYLAAILVAVYSVGAHYSPYAYNKLKPYAYLWVIGAIILYIIALFLPTFKIHSLLKKAKKKYLITLDHRKKKINSLINDYWGQEEHNRHYIREANSLLQGIMYLQNEVDKMQEWPYKNPGWTLINLSVLQASVTALAGWEGILKFIHKSL